MKTIGVVTVARSDYGIYIPLLRKLTHEPNLNLHLLVTGMHLSPEFGSTVKMIEQDGFPIGDRIEMLLSSDSPEAVSKSIGLGIIGFAQSFAKLRPDVLILLGDRFEMYAAAVAALPFKIPMAHIHGGEITQGAIDDTLRHSLSKFSHLHFVATEEYRTRVIQLGEEPGRVFLVGALGLDHLIDFSYIQKKELEKLYDLKLDRPLLLATFHPVTLEFEQTEWQVRELLAALERVGLPVLFTSPNADTNGRMIAAAIKEFSKDHDSVRVVDNLGTKAYFSLMANATAMVGNSSSGIIEAASFKLPVVNVGNRQKGRVQGENIINVGYSKEDIVKGIKRAISKEFRESLKEIKNPYVHGNAATKIIEILKKINYDDNLIMKSFYDIHS